ncbi:IclR family transcriptional regulator domain-containing protein [Allorhizobium undicola]|uniref:IclR family transcriptional regulator domain-containing protein n=1 Tax=Allorhizobium undicola TaxID=78527 RepID=UPI00048513D6|nr:IclR family transcriptional regulator C-terminal domain-containing protein [Allorhizobium undicola]
MNEERPKADNAAAVLKVFAVLEALVEDRRVSLADIAQKAMTSKTTAHRLIQTMVDLGYVEQDPETERYGLTLKLFSMGARTLSERTDLLRVADKVMGRLSRKTGESINLGVLDEWEHKVTYIHKYDSAFSLSMRSTLGLRNPLHSTSLGKALMAWRDEEEVLVHLKAMEMQKLAPNTITDPAVYLEQLRVTRARGYAEEIEESEAGVRCMATPILNHLGQSIAAISVAFPLFRFQETRLEEYIQLLREAGEAASTAFGHVGPIAGRRSGGE